MSTKRYLSATEVAQRLGITVGAWSGYVRKGLTPEPSRRHRTRIGMAPGHNR